MEYRDSSGAQHRSGFATLVDAGSCLRSHHRCCRLGHRLRHRNRLPSRRFGWLIGGRPTHTQRGRNPLGFRRLQELLKVAVFLEDIGERLLNYIDGGSADKCRKLIDSSCSQIRQSNGRANAAVLRGFRAVAYRSSRTIQICSRPV
jgi:hypothetical protein